MKYKSTVKKVIKMMSIDARADEQTVGKKHNFTRFYRGYIEVFFFFEFVLHVFVDENVVSVATDS